jgi:hypothetical protein
VAPILHYTGRFAAYGMIFDPAHPQELTQQLLTRDYQVRVRSFARESRRWSTSR